MARDFGADFAINPLKDDPVEAIRDLTRGGLGVEKAVECSSNPIARQQAMKVVRQWGTTCLVGVHGAMEFECNELITKQKSLVGSLTFSKNIQDECAQFVAERGINVDALFTHEFSLDQAVEAYELFEQRKIGKGVFIFD
jgi:threonine dehydrogenase-like Zn-dependent dehydrogenase